MPWLRRRRIAGLVFCAWVLSAHAASEPPPEIVAWLGRMTHALQSLDYDGVFVYLHGDQMSTMRVVHTVDGDEERERLLALDGPVREVIRNKRSVTCILADRSAVVMSHRADRNQFPLIVPANLGALSPVYDLRLGGTDRVIGRSAQILSIEPKDKYRYGYRIWLDRATALPLKTAVVDEEGTAVEQITFTSLRVGEEVIPPPGDSPVEVTRLSPDREERVTTTNEEDPRPPRIQVANLPPGFHLTHRNRLTLEHGGSPVDHFLYSDGLASVSIYLQDQVEPDALIGSSVMGAVSAFGEVVQGHHVTVMGKVPEAAARAIGESVSIEGGAP